MIQIKIGWFGRFFRMSFGIPTMEGMSNLIISSFVSTRPAECIEVISGLYCSEMCVKDRDIRPGFPRRDRGSVISSLPSRGQTSEKFFFRLIPVLPFYYYYHPSRVVLISPISNDISNNFQFMNRMSLLVHVAVR